MPVTEDPTVATQLAQFGDAANEAASIKYNVPLPGAYSFERVVSIEVPSPWLDEQVAMGAGTSLEELGVIEGQTIDRQRLRSLYQRNLIERPPAASPSIQSR